LDWPARIRAALAAQQQTPDADVIEELSHHAASTYEAARADGCDVPEATRRVDALIAAWCADAARLRRRPMRQPMPPPPPVDGAAWAGLMQDVKYGLRLLRRQPGFTFVAVLTMALGIGATTTLFGVVYGVLLKPLPWPDPDRIVRISESRGTDGPRLRGIITNGTYNAWQESKSTIEALGGYVTSSAPASIDAGDAFTLAHAKVTPSVFTVLEAAPVRGRLFVDDDAMSGASDQPRNVVILSYGLWQERFGGADEALGRTMQIDGKSFTVVGVMPRGFAFPDRVTRAWTPFTVASVLAEGGVHRIMIFQAMARLRAGVSAARAAAEATARARSAPDPGLAAVAMFGGHGQPQISVTPALDAMVGSVKDAILILFGAVVLLLATATANVASLQLARATTRRREMAIRSALGAGTARVTRQLLVESLLLGAGGGMAGVALAVAVYRVLPAALPADFPRSADIGVNGWVLAFATALATVTSVAFGMLPVLQARRVNMSEALAEDGQAPVGGGGRSRVARTRTVIMAGQLAVSCVLLVGAALLGRSFLALLNADRGYDPRNLLTARLPLPADYSLGRRNELLDAIVGRMRAMPNVSAVGFGNALPFVTTGGFRGFRMRPPIDPANEVDVHAITRVVSPGYFQALSLRVIAGRALSDADTMTSQESVVVNRSFAARYLGAHPVGLQVPNLGMCRGDDDRWEVVGVVEDMKQNGVADPPEAEIFMPYGQVGCPAAVSTPVIVVRTVDDPLGYAAVLRGVLREQAPSLALDSVMTMEERVMSSLERPRFYAVLLGGFAGFAVLIAGVGLFGVLSYSVAQRSREIGVRTALGARPGDIARLVVRQAFMMTAAGLAAGLWAAFALVQYLSTFLYGVTTHDAASFVIVPLVLAVVAAIACLVPARRAARMDPLKALRT